MKRPRFSSNEIVFGGTPRVNLMPPEFEEKRRASLLKRRLLWAIGVVTAAVIVGVGAVSVQLVTTNVQLANEKARTALLLQEQKKYIDVTLMKDQILEIQTAQPAASSGDVRWMPYLAKIQATLPAGTTITAFTATLEEAIAGGAGGLEKPHVAIVSMTADSPQASVSDWLDNLATLKGFVDATPRNVVVVTESGRYTVDVDLLLDENALVDTYNPKKMWKKNG